MPFFTGVAIPNIFIHRYIERRKKRTEKNLLAQREDEKKNYLSHEKEVFFWIFGKRTC